MITHALMPPTVRGLVGRVTARVGGTCGLAARRLPARRTPRGCGAFPRSVGIAGGNRGGVLPHQADDQLHLDVELAGDPSPVALVDRVDHREQVQGLVDAAILGERLPQWGWVCPG